MVNLIEMREYGIVVSFKHEADLHLTRCGIIYRCLNMGIVVRHS